MKTAVETVFVGKERRFNRRFLQMCSHYLVEERTFIVSDKRSFAACTPASGWEKGQVEIPVSVWCASGSSRRDYG